jgi:hypothetical protein
LLALIADATESEMAELGSRTLEAVPLGTDGRGCEGHVEEPLGHYTAGSLSLTPHLAVSRFVDRAICQETSHFSLVD